MLRSLALTASLVVIASRTSLAEMTPLVEYRADSSWIGDVGASVKDASGNGHDGAVVDQPVGTSTDVPEVAQAGELSFDFSGDSEGPASGSINTTEKKLLNRSAIVAAGGFTMETWFKTPMTNGSGATASLIDYAGTERIQFNVKANVLEFRISDRRHRVESAQSLPELADDQWHHVKASFVVTDGTLLDPVYGDIHITVDGVTRSEYGVELSGYGDRLKRAIGVGNHPERFGKPGYDGADDFDGLLYRPAVYLGAESPGRWLWLVGTGLLVMLGGVAWIVIRQPPEESEGEEAVQSP